MDTTLYRITRPGDEEQLRQIWTLAYDGDSACAELYFRDCYQPGDGVVAEAGGELCSAIYLMDGFLLHFPGQPPRTCTYLYALGTPKRHRGHGYGGKTIWRAGVEGYQRGADFVCFLPASESLARWYEGILGTRAVFFRRTCSVERSGRDAGGRVEPIPPEAYAALRSRLLAGQPHAECPRKAVRLQGRYCEQYGGGLCRISVDGAEGIAAWDREEDRLLFHELLFPEGDPRRAAEVVLAAQNAASAVVRVPAFWHDGLGEVEPDNVLIPGGTSFPASEALPYWGLSMD